MRGHINNTYQNITIEGVEYDEPYYHVFVKDKESGLRTSCNENKCPFKLEHMTMTQKNTNDCMEVVVLYEMPK